MRIQLSLLAALLAGALHAQPDRDPLTKDFDHMNSKERNKVAAKEQADAAQDPVFQALMNEAEARFRTRDYDGALAKYREARALRPYNVHPKVKIEDLEALIAKQAAAAKDTASAEPPPKPDSAKTSPPEVPAPKASAPAPVAVGTTPPVPTTRPIVPAKVQPVATPPSYAHTTPPQGLPDGVMERRFVEGNHHVIERTVTNDGTTVIYRRVQYDWGGVYFFKDGTSVDERVWKDMIAQP